MSFDPFGDFQTAGYLRNKFGFKESEAVKDVENLVYIWNISEAIDWLSSVELDYNALKKTHAILFLDFYPWAGQDRAQNAPDIAISRGGYNTLFAHPASVEKGVAYALRDLQAENFSPSKCFSDLAHAHPFLDGNGRAILTFHSEIMRRTGQHVEWYKTEKFEFLEALTLDLENPGRGHFEAYLSPFVMPGSLTLDEIGRRLTELARRV